MKTPSIAPIPDEGVGDGARHFGHFRLAYAALSHDPARIDVILLAVTDQLQIRKQCDDANFEDIQNRYQVLFLRGKWSLEALVEMGKTNFLWTQPIISHDILPVSFIAFS